MKIIEVLKFATKKNMMDNLIGGGVLYILHPIRVAFRLDGTKKK